MRFFKETPCYEFVDFLNGGLQINLITVVDFTGSNGIPTAPSSLHYMFANSPNQYQSAITNVAEILLNYNSTQLVPCYGFGAIWAKPPAGFGPNFLQPSSQTHHFFPMSGDFQNTAGKGIQGVIELYKHALAYTKLSGPTYFAPAINEIINYTQAKLAENPMNYTVLLLLTDGCIHDMSETINAIVKGSHLPLSIIIVGVGNEDFKDMEVLDSDGVVLRTALGVPALRDIVQFVDFKSCRLDGLLLS